MQDVSRRVQRKRSKKRLIEREALQESLHHTGGEQGEQDRSKHLSPGLGGLRAFRHPQPAQPYGEMDDIVQGVDGDEACSPFRDQESRAPSRYLKPYR